MDLERFIFDLDSLKTKEHHELQAERAKALADLTEARKRLLEDSQ